MSLQIVQNQQLKPIGDKVPIDTTLSSSSENAISNKAVTEEITRINSDLTEFSNMKSEVLDNASADWVQVGKVVTVYFGTVTTYVIFNNLPMPYERDRGVVSIPMRQASDGTVLQGFFGATSDGKAQLVCPTANLCYGTLTYITV